MSDNKPTSLREILETLVKNFASLEQDNDGSYWWGHDTNLGNQSEAFDQAIAAITALVPEKRPTDFSGTENSETINLVNTHFNACIDTIKRNFNGQTDNNNKEQS